MSARRRTAGGQWFAPGQLRIGVLTSDLSYLGTAQFQQYSGTFGLEVPKGKPYTVGEWMLRPGQILLNGSEVWIAQDDLRQWRVISAQCPPEGS